METAATNETRQLVWLRNGAFCSLFLVAICDGLTYLLLVNVLYHWTFFAALLGLPIAIWKVTDSLIRGIDLLPWQPLSAFLFWPVVLPVYLYKTRGWQGIGMLCAIGAFILGVKMVTIAAAMILLLLIHGFPGPG